MSVYIPTDNSTSGDVASKSWAKSRFATKSALTSKLSIPANDPAPANRILISDGTNPVWSAYNVTDISTLNGNVDNLLTRITTSKVNIGPTSKTNQGESTVAIGEQAGTTNQGANSIAIGTGAGSSGQYSAAIAIGNGAGASSQASDSIALGNGAGGSALGAASIAIGKNAATNNTVATSNNIILNATGSALNTAVSNATYVKPIRADTTKTSALCYDTTSGEVVADSTIKSNITSLQTTTTSSSSRVASSTVKVGTNAGNTGQGAGAVAIGLNCAQSNQGAESVCIGDNAAYYGSGTNSINIGLNAAYSASASNSICLNATGNSLNTTVSGFHVAPIRFDNFNNSLSNVLIYNTNTKEIAYNYNNISLSSVYLNQTMAYLQADNSIGSPNQLMIAGRSNSNKQLCIGYNTENNYAAIESIFAGSVYTPLLLNPTSGQVCVNYQNAARPAATNVFAVNGSAYKSDGSTVWNTSSDPRVKLNVETADVNRCYSIMKDVPLRRFTWDPKYYPNMKDRRVLGWLADEVAAVLPKAVESNPQTFVVSGSGPDSMNPDIPDTRVYETIEHFKTVDSDQVLKVMYGTIKSLMSKVEALEIECAELRSEVNLLKTAQ